METLLVTLAAIAGGAWLVFAACRLRTAQSRLATLRAQRRRDLPGRR